MKHLKRFNENLSESNYNIEFMIGDGDWYVDFDYKVENMTESEFESLLEKVIDHEPDYILGKMGLHEDEKKEIESIFKELPSHVENKEAYSYVTNSNYFYLTGYKKIK